MLLTHDCTAKFSSNHIIKFADDTSVVGLISNNDETHYREEVAYLAKWCGVNNPSLIVGKTKEVVMDFRRNSIDHPHWPSTARQWRVSAALNSWGCTSQRISSEPPTPCHSPRRHTNAYTLSAGWKVQVSLLTTFYRGTIESMLTSCITVWYGNCKYLTARPSSGQLQKSSVPLSPPSWIVFIHDAPAKPIVSWRTPPILPTVSSSSYHQENGTRASEPASPDCSTAFSPRLWEPWTQLTTPLSETPYKPPFLLKHGPPPTPILTTSQEKTVKPVCAIKSVLHTGEWACTNHLW